MITFKKFLHENDIDARLDSVEVGLKDVMKKIKAECGKFLTEASGKPLLDFPPVTPRNEPPSRRHTQRPACQCHLSQSSTGCSTL